MSTTAQSTASAMLPEEGAAVRYQLDAMIKALTQFDEDAAKSGDATVQVMVARLHEARAAAQTIETRNQPQPAYRGVRLARP